MTPETTLATSGRGILDPFEALYPDGWISGGDGGSASITRGDEGTVI